MKKMTKAIHNYFRKYNKTYKIINLLLISTIISAALVYIDYLNFLSKEYYKIADNIISVIAIIFSLTVLLILLKYDVKSFFKYPLINRLDSLLLTTILSSTIFRLLIIVGYPNTVENFLIIYIIQLVMVFFIVIRMYFINRKNNTQENKNVFELQQIIENEFSVSSNLIIRESSATDDLLNREYLVKDLVRVAKEFNADEKFVIGLEGDWGSGKTTVLNLFSQELKSDNNIIVIDDFDPWLSEDKEALLNNLLNHILKEINIGIPDKSINKLVLELSEVVLGDKKIKPIIGFWEKDQSANEIIKDINYLLAANNKKIVFIIDNLDRLLPENIFLILNIVNNVLTVNNLIIILSYDAKELTKSLATMNISAHYLDKIVQKKVVIPFAEKGKVEELYSKTLCNLLDSKKVEYEIEDIRRFSKILSEKVITLRDFKRFLNSSVIPFILGDLKLAVFDYLAIEYLRMFDIQLYRNIFTNSKKFLNFDLGFEEAFKYFDETKLDKELNSFFERIGLNESSNKDMLRLLFPNVKHYFEDGQNYKRLRNSNPKSKENIDIQTHKRIASGKFFDLYFTQQYNKEALHAEFAQLIINSISDELELNQKINQLTELVGDEQVKVLEYLYIYIEPLTIEDKKNFSKELLNNYYKFRNENTKSFGMLNTISRLSVIISESLEGLDEESFESILLEYVKNPKNIALISELKYWTGKSNINNDEKIYFLEKSLDELINKTFDTEVNLFENDIYSKKNIYIMHEYLEKNGSLKNFFRYIEDCLNDDTFFRILDYLVEEASDSDYRNFYIMNEKVDQFMNIEILKHYSERASAVNDKQILLQNVFENHLIAEPDYSGEKHYYIDNFIDRTTID